MRAGGCYCTPVKGRRAVATPEPAPGAPAMPQGDASPRQPRQECLLSPQPAARKYFPSKKRPPSVFRADGFQQPSVAVLFCRRRDTYPEEERRRRWESFKKLWLSLFHPGRPPLERGFRGCKTPGGCLGLGGGRWFPVCLGCPNPPAQHRAPGEEKRSPVPRIAKRDVKGCPSSFPGWAANVGQSPLLIEIQ